ncbi:MAG: arylesterase [Geobacteraceae bacterium]|nr:arylesterase [Geobacteraceae bacterium]
MKGMVIGFTGTVLAIGCLLAGCERRSEPGPAVRREQPAFEGTVVAVGDSLTAGYGVREEDAYPARLEKKLREAGYRWRVVNAGISGETSSGTLSRVNWVLRLKPDIVILETGANDGLRGIDPRLTRENIDETVRILKQNGVTVILAGMRMVTNLGREYTDAFAAVYPALARKHELILVPFFLAGVAGDRSLNQPDGIHPLPEGYRIIVETVWPYLLRAVEGKKRERKMNR